MKRRKQLNIDHINDEGIDVPVGFDNTIKAIFERQEFLHDKYKGIEYKNGLGLGLVKDIPFSLDDPTWQYILKDFSWRVTEELTEAQEADYEQNEIHATEELIDALHFYTEMLIISGYTPEDIINHDGEEYIDLIFMGPVYFIGVACNLLKNKPWKNTHLITDEKRFKENMIKGYHNLLDLILNYGTMKTNELYIFYYKKSLVNKFRMDSNY